MSGHGGNNNQPRVDSVTELDLGANTKALAVVSVDKTYPPFVGYFRDVASIDYSTLAVAGVKDAYTVTVVDGTNFVVNEEIAIWTTTRFYGGKILGKAGNVLTLATPLNFAYPIGANASSGNPEMSVDGSGTPVVYRIRQPQLPVLATGLEFVITRIIFSCLADSAVDLSLFGNIAALTRGCMLRYENGVTSNIFTVRSNQDIANFAYDWTAYVATNPSQGQDGFVSRLTFGSNGKMGTSILLKDGEALEFWIQDNLTGLTSLKVVAEGYIRGVS
jgi:hypothetical protein